MAHDPSRLATKWGLTPHAALHLARLLDAVPGLGVSSGRRSAARNRIVGGVPDSFHLRGRAVDLVGSRSSLLRASRVARSQRVTPTCTGPEEVIDEGTHLHVAW